MVIFKSLSGKLQLVKTSRFLSNSVRHISNIQASTKNENRNLPESADVVIIGGGVAGCSALYNLAKIGVTDSILLESHQLTAGTTWHTAGLIFPVQADDVLIRLVKETREVIATLEEETGIDPGYVNNGAILTIRNKVEMDEMNRLISIAKAQDLEGYILDQTEAKSLYPLLNTDNILGVAHFPSDGTLDPTGYCNALAKSATMKGSKIFEKCPVTNLIVKENIHGGRALTHVETAEGRIKTNCVINCTGAWTNNLLKKIGVSLPYQVFKHSYVVTDTIPGIQNMPNIRARFCSGYLKLQGDALTIGTFENNPVFINTELENDRPFSLYELDWETMNLTLEGATELLPILKDIGIKSTICGPESFTTDGKPILGEDPNVRGLFYSSNFSSSGMAYSGGCGKEIATWVTKGRPNLDMFGYDIRRFNPSLIQNKQYIQERAHEVMSRRYSTKYVHDESLSARGLKKSALHEILERNGCVFQERYGWERPGWFSKASCPVQPYDWYGAYDAKRNSNNSYIKALEMDYSFDSPGQNEQLRDECVSTRTTSGLIDMSFFGKFYLIGPDAQKAANWLFTANVDSNPGKTVYTCMLNESGKVEADLTVSILDAGQLLSSEPSFKGVGFYLNTGGSVTNHIESHIRQQIRIYGWDVELHNSSDDLSILSLQGPLSRKIFRTITNDNLSNDVFPYLTNKIMKVRGKNARILRVSFVGELGYELHVPNNEALPLYEALLEAGKIHKMKEIGFRALDSLSAEKGYLHWHQDLRMEDSPLEAGLRFTCKLKHSVNFLGRQALEAEENEPLKKKLITFTINDPKTHAWGLEPLFRNNELIGMVRRAEFAYNLGKTIGYAYVNKPNDSEISKEFLSTGKWWIESMNKKCPIKVHLVHPFDAAGKRLCK